MNKLIPKQRVVAMVVLLVLLLTVYLVFLYRVQIIEGEDYYNASSELQRNEETVTASRGDILDRYGRVLISNKECYNLTIDTGKLFSSEDPNAVLLELINMVEEFGDTYVDDLPITRTPPFDYDPNMTEIQRTMLDAYFQDKAKSLPANPTAVELLSYMRSRYDIDSNYSAEDMRKIAGLRYSINVRYAINTAEYVFVQDASMKLITSIMETKLAGIQVKRAYTRDYQTNYAAHILGYTGLPPTPWSARTASSTPLRTISTATTARWRSPVPPAAPCWPTTTPRSRSRATTSISRWTSSCRSRWSVSSPTASTS